MAENNTTEHVCRDFRYSPPGSNEYVYRCVQCNEIKQDTHWPCMGSGNTEDRAARVPIGRM